MAKKAKKHAPPKELTRKQQSHIERERRIQKFLLWGVAAVGIVIVGILVYGLVVEKVIKAREPVASVGDVPITMAELEARTRFMRMQMQTELQYWVQQQQALDPTDTSMQFYLEYIQGNIRDLQTQLSPENVPVIEEQSLDQLIQEELVRQEAEHRGITVASEKVQQEIEQFFGYDRNPATPTPAPGATPPLTPTESLTPVPTTVPLPTPTPMTEEEFQQLYTTYLKQSLKPLDISEKQFRSWVEVSLLTEKLREEIEAQIPATADQVNLRTMSVDSEERANELVARLDDGEDFQTLADELENDEEVTGHSVELGWLPRSILEQNLGPELTDLAFSLEVGEHSQPVPEEGGMWYTIILVVDHEERELEPFARQQLGADAFQEWLNAQQVLVERLTYAERVPTEP